MRNNIAFIPSYGSIQGADMTLQTKRGNALDTASLLIALLRAANVPARYVYGTIKFCTDKPVQTNLAIPGLTTPVLSTFLTASFVAESIGGMTLITAIKLSIKNPIFLLGNLRAALITSIVNFVLMSIAFEIGLLIGSGVSAAICRRN